MLLLLTVIAVGFLSLSTLSTRANRSDWALEEARSNARLALMVAMAELQRDLGPDRRVSATASILDDTPGSEEVSGVDQPHWTGAWMTDEFDGNIGTPWIRRDSQGGLHDLRFPSKLNSGGGYNREERVLNWFVSGNEGGWQNNDNSSALISPLRSPVQRDENSDEAVQLVGSGSAAENEDFVSVPRTFLRKVRTTPTGQRLPTISGSYGYWVNDLGVKANVGLADRHIDESYRGGGAGYQRILHAQMYDPSSLAGLGRVEPEDLNKVVSRETLALAGGGDADDIKLLYHDITPYSRSVLSNTRDGGLQRNLTAFLNGNGANIRALDDQDHRYQGLLRNDKLVGPANPRASRYYDDAGHTWGQALYQSVAPTFSLMADFYALSQGTQFGLVERRQLDGDVTDLVQSNNNVNVYDQTNRNGPRFNPHQSLNLNPVMTSSSVYYNLGATAPTGTGANRSFGLRMYLYPRICLWNPYNVQLNLPDMMAQVFLNGNKFILAENTTGQSSVRVQLHYGGLSPTQSGGLRGQTFYSLEGAVLEPGECLMWCPVGARAYNYNNFLGNRMSPTVEPDPSKFFSFDVNLGDTTIRSRPARFREINPEPNNPEGNSNGADNLCVMIKSGSAAERGAFAELPMMSYVNNALQAGGNDEIGQEWALGGPTADIFPAFGATPPATIPDARTRDSIRLRWWQETDANLNGRGENLPHEALKSALVANWNLRAAYSCRTPWENLSPEAPFQFGMYISDFPDENATSWQAMRPRPGDDKNIAHPFGQHTQAPQNGIILFEVPRSEPGIQNLAYFRHMKTSEFSWHPSMPIGNSLADPRLRLQGLTGTNPALDEIENGNEFNGWNSANMGFDPRRLTSRGRIETNVQDYWAYLTRQIIYDAPRQGAHPVYDLSYEVNYTLWDDYFMSTGSQGQLRNFVDSPLERPLPNGRMSLFQRDGGVEEAFRNPRDNFFMAAYFLALDGGFNVHSTSVEAWKALLGSARQANFPGTRQAAFPRFLSGNLGTFNGVGNLSTSAIYSGFRSLSDNQIEQLARAMVTEVKLRAPFMGLGDFVNRRLDQRLTSGRVRRLPGNEFQGKRGAIESAIYESGANVGLMSEFDMVISSQGQGLDASGDLRDYTVENIQDASRIDIRLKPENVLWGMPGWLTQGDVLQVIGSSLRTRSDSFAIRAYGDARDVNGNVRARAWCEAIVQRYPEPVQPDSVDVNGIAINPPLQRGRATDGNFGRRFRMVSFRWLSQDEI